jgi:RND family efflux transporter MFP subunit
VVVLKDAEVGEVVSPNVVGGSSARGAVCTLVDFDSLEVQADVPETSLAAVAEDAPANIYLDAYPDQRYTGRVSRIWPTADRQKATVEVRVTIDEPDRRLRPEMGVRVVFSPEEDEGDTASEAHILISLDALVTVDGQEGVFVLERDVVRFRPVETGEERSGRVAIQSGLRSGETIVLSPPTSLNDGDRVRIE